MPFVDRNPARRRLDARLTPYRPLGKEPRPHKGWIRAIRDALGMSSSELAQRMGLTQQAIVKLERSELRDTIQLDTLRRAADALDCDLVYALVPRTTLQETVAEQASRRAMAVLRPLAHHSRLEDQSVTDEEYQAQLDDLLARFVDRRGLWTIPEELPGD